jgi:hypothetical protein
MGSGCPQLYTLRLVRFRTLSLRGTLCLSDSSWVWPLLTASLFISRAYWRIYNLLNLGTADAMVPFYADLGELSESQNVYHNVMNTVSVALNAKKM